MSSALAREVAALAGRLADLLAQALPVESGVLADGQDFLRAVAGAGAEAGPEDKLAGEGSAIDWEAGQAPAGVAVEPLDRLVTALSLTGIERDMLLLAGLTDEHEGFAGVLRSLHPRNEPYATVGLAAQLFCRSAVERALLRRIMDRGAVARTGVLHLEDGRPFFERTLRVAEGLWSVLHGIDAWPAAVVAIEGPTPAAGLERWLAAVACRRASAALDRGEPCTVLVTAESVDAACGRAAVLATAAGVRAARLTPAAGVALTEFEPLASVHALARGCVPIVRLPPSEDGSAPLSLTFVDYPRPVILCARSDAVRVHGARPVFPVAVERLSHADRRAMWEKLLPPLRNSAATLGARYGVEPADAAAAAADVHAMAAVENRAPSLDDVATSIRIRGGGGLAAGIKLIHPTATWDQLVLPHDRLLQLREAVDRLLNQARVIDEWGFLNGRPGAHGVRMLLSGPPGTGKTLAAEVLAGELGVDLMLVDIARVVSKWIGETEKNLAAVFDCAEQGQAVLLFDEADALFGKRTEVSDAHDRYANLETAYLLSRLERFDGLAILSTNLRQNIDPAFVRRLEFVVEFNEPNLAERLQLWRCHLPAPAPLAADADLHELATLYPVVGGLIRNAAVAAGFMAAAENTAIGRRELIRAIRREYDKAGYAFPGAPWGLDVL